MRSSLHFESDQVVAMPKIKMLRLQNTRKGFFEIDDLQAVIEQLPDHLRAPILTCYFTGWRIREVLTRQKRHCDLDAGWLRIEPGESKNGEGRVYPLGGELLELLTAQREHVSALERSTGQIIPFVFPDADGKPIRDYRYFWQRACRNAGVAGKLVHDLRRTSVRNMETSRSLTLDGDEA